jgi:hypothetical protein
MLLPRLSAVTNISFRENRALLLCYHKSISSLTMNFTFSTLVTSLAFFLCTKVTHSAILYEWNICLYVSPRMYDTVTVSKVTAASYITSNQAKKGNCRNKGVCKEVCSSYTSFEVTKSNACRCLGAEIGTNSTLSKSSPAPTFAPIAANVSIPSPVVASAPLAISSPKPSSVVTSVPLKASTTKPTPGQTLAPIVASTARAIHAPTSAPMKANTSRPVPVRTSAPISANTPKPTRAATAAPVATTKTSKPSLAITSTPIATVRSEAPMKKTFCSNPYGNPCGPGSRCTDTPTGISCSPINLEGCPWGCGFDATCQKTSTGLFDCICNPGYSIRPPFGCEADR